MAGGGHGSEAPVPEADPLVGLQQHVGAPSGGGCDHRLAAGVERLQLTGAYSTAIAAAAYSRVRDTEITSGRYSSGECNRQSRQTDVPVMWSACTCVLSTYFSVRPSSRTSCASLQRSSSTVATYTYSV